MALITYNEVATLLQLSGNTYDAQINAFIPLVRDFIVDYTHNRFLTDRYIYSGNLTFNDVSPATITDSDSQFVANYLSYAKDIYVSGTKYNDGYYKVASVAAGTITLESGESLNAEASDNIVPIIHAVEWPKGLKKIAAKIIGYDLQTNIDKGVQSESIGGYSVSYAITGAYPDSILKALDVYRKLWE